MSQGKRDWKAQNYGWLTQHNHHSQREGRDIVNYTRGIYCKIPSIWELYATNKKRKK